jgi:hypothetical protein
VSKSGILLLLTLVLVGCASHQSQRSGEQAPTRTAVKTFSAFGADGDLVVRVADVTKGRCWTTSIAAPASGAYRCIAGNAIFDPCFAPPDPAKPLELACVADPWSNAEVLQVSGALPTGGPADGGPRPWAFELDNGVRCVAATGTVPAVDGVDLGYDCRNGWYAALRDTVAATVTARYGNPGTQVLRTVTVATIWRA